MQPEYFEWLVSKVTSPAVPADESARAVMGALYGIRIGVCRVLGRRCAYTALVLVLYTELLTVH